LDPLPVPVVKETAVEALHSVDAVDAAAVVAVAAVVAAKNALLQWSTVRK